MPKMHSLITFGILIASIRICFGGSVLFLPPMTSSSHKLAMVVWADAMAERGHDVYWFSPTPKLDHYQPKKTPHVDHFEVDVDDPYALSAFRFENNSLMSYMWWNSDWAVPPIETYVSVLLTEFCENVIKDHKSKWDRVLSRKYDLVILDELFNPCAFALTQLLKSPVAVYISTCRQTRMANKFNGVHVPWSYVPHMGSMSILSDQMTFVQRVTNTLAWTVGHLGDALMFPMVTRSIRKFYPDVAPIESGMVLPDFQFICMPKQLDLTLPSPGNLIYIGGIQIPSEIAPLNDEFRNMVDSAKKGFVVVAMGHWANWLTAPPIVKRAFIETMSNLSSDYLVIWQYKGTPITDLPKHVKTVAWIPQQSLLAHPKCVLFLTHAGCNSLTEGVHYAVPMVAVPLSADQPDGASKITKLGFGVHLHKLNVTTESLSWAVNKVLNDNRYRSNVKKYSDLLKSETMSPVEKTVFWTEYAMKHGHKKHYQSSPRSTNVSWFQYYSVDTIAVLGSSLILTIYVTLNALCFLWRFVVGDKAIKEKKSN